MKVKKLFRYSIPAIPILLVLVVIAIMAVSYYYPYHYIKNCLYSNKDEFEQILAYIRKDYGEQNTHIKIDKDSKCKEISSILNRLRAQYQNDSEYPVFSAIDVYFDSDGDLLLYLHAKKEKLKNGDGMDTPDIRCYDLVYIDENYDGSSAERFKYKEPFWGNWYTWSFDTYSG